MNTSEPWYRAWRRAEAHMLPMTVEGVERANIRAAAFKSGYEAGVKGAAHALETEHSEVKKTHSFFYLASEMVRKLI
ncbi:hypothetical protein NVP1081O_208 [Vibrio phage 1.081.O._10N.286.52.C2]|nr:hypothetical protein NVP1081O_208 [Vibrio phage 1.081.O._10N.286.52.C2]